MPYNLIFSRNFNFWIKNSYRNIAIDYWTTWNVKKEILLNYKVKQAVPYGIDLKTKDEDIEYFLQIYPLILDELKDILNEHHNISGSNRYWKIILGPWLYTFILVTFHHWKSIQNVLKDYEIKKVKIDTFPHDNLIPNTFLDFSKIYKKEIWDQYIYSDIIKNFTDLEYEDLNDSNLSSNKEKIKNEISDFRPKKSQFINQLKKTATLLINPLARFLTKKNDALIVSTCLPFWEEVKLNFLLGQMPLPRINKDFHGTKVDLKKRKSLYPQSSKHEGFESFIRSRIFLHIPSIYLEGFKEARKKALELPWPSEPKFIYTASNFDWDELFKIYTAEKVDKGSKYIIGQHGGYYGVAKFWISEWHERSSSDYFLTWGWGGNNFNTKKSIFVLQAGVKKDRSNNLKNMKKLLLVQRHGAHKQFSWDESHDYKKYLKNLMSFTKNIKNDIFRKMLVRLYSDEHVRCWSEEQFWEKGFPEIKIDDGTQPIFNLYKEAKITVLTTETTGFIELIYLNRPCIMFYEKDYFPIREDAQEIYQLLEKYKLIHRSPIEAAKFINLIWDDIYSWWNNPDLVKVKNIFLSRFGRMPVNHLQDLALTLKSCK